MNGLSSTKKLPYRVYITRQVQLISLVVVTNLIFIVLLSPSTVEAQQTTFDHTRRAIALEASVPSTLENGTDLLNHLGSNQQAIVRNSAVPVLLPRNNPNVTVTSDPSSFTANWEDEGARYSLEGSRLAYAYEALTQPAIAMEHSIRDHAAITVQNEGILDVTWNELGVSYLLSLDCTKPKDSRCQSSEAIQRQGDLLDYAGGGIKNQPLAEPTSEIPHAVTSHRKDFTYDPPGTLVPGSGTGRKDLRVYAPGIRFPIENGPAYANSQVWNAGGDHGPKGGSQCDHGNYSYPWSDNFCETRDRSTPMCGSQKGHQGQDIRPATCQKDVYKGVAVCGGVISHIGSYSVFLKCVDGTQYRYLHMSNVAVQQNQSVKQGTTLGLISDIFEATPTTIHLHFEIVQNISGIGFTHVPPYTSLIDAYQLLP